MGTSGKGCVGHIGGIRWLLNGHALMQWSCPEHGCTIHLPRIGEEVRFKSHLFRVENILNDYDEQVISIVLKPL